MHKIFVIAVGKRMPHWIEQGYAHYAKQIHSRVKLQLIEIHPAKRGRNADLQRLAGAEEDKIRKAIPDSARVVVLERTGQSWSSLALSRKLAEWINLRQPVALVVGGPEGLSTDFLGQADEVWSLSALTLPHGLVRLVLAEQLYRGLSILEGSPYHR